MEINSLGSTNGALPQQQVTARQPQQEIAERPRENSDAARASAAQAAANQQAAAQRSAPAERPEQPRPVVNAQGQKTGTIINTTA